MTDWMLIIGMTLVTFLPRYIPFAMAGRITVAPWLVKSLYYVPIAVLTSIIVQTALVQDGELSLTLGNHHLVASLAAFFTALISRNLLRTVIVGLLCFGVLQWVMPF